jgi:hypothetical protein
MHRNFLQNNSVAILIVSLLTIYCQQAAAQINSHAVYWIKYQNQLNFSSKVWWTNELDNRRFIKPDLQTQFIFHSRVHYKKDRWEYGGGLTLSWAYATLPESPIRHATMEVRPVMEISYEIPMRKWFLSHRLRVDHRFIEEDKYTSVFDESNYIMRLRYRISSRFPLKTSDEGKVLILGKVANEIMFNHEENIFDQNRIYASAEFTINKHWAFEAGYIYIYQQRYARDEFLERHVLRCSFLHRLYLY